MAKSENIKHTKAVMYYKASYLLLPARDICTYSDEGECKVNACVPERKKVGHPLCGPTILYKQLARNFLLSANCIFLQIAYLHYELNFHI